MRQFHDTPPSQSHTRRKIAVIGSGIAGLGAAWLLRNQFDVTVFEADSRLGGHANTVDIEIEGQRASVDTGFLVFNRRTYPHLSALFDHLNVDVADSEMSFGVSLAASGIEWAGADLNSVFAQRRNLLRPDFIGMLHDIMRFNRSTTAMAAIGAMPTISVGDYIAKEKYGSAFRDWYLLPMAAAIWSCPTKTMLAYPLATFVRFCHNHGLLQISNRPQWLTVRNGSRNYVERIAQDLHDLRLSTPVRAIVRHPNCVELLTDKGGERFDEVVFACHSDQTLRLLGEQATGTERAVLGAIPYQMNRAVLHTDTSLLPRNRRVWSAWNYMAGEGRPDQRPVSVSYLINRLQPVPFKQPVIVSLNPFQRPAPDTILRSIEYAHPVFDERAIAAQARLPEIQGVQRAWFIGAWTGYGFHEDGLRSAVTVAQSFGVDVPWLKQSTPAEKVCA